MGKAFHLEATTQQVAVLTFDQPESKVNTFSGPVMRELSALVDQLDGRTDLRGLLLRSGKPGQFIAGADLNELAALAYATPEQAAGGLARGHELFDRISRLPFPTIALIDGPCMGGGTELILAMDERIASTNPKTDIALPEVKIGIIPGWGGTQRLPRLIGVPNAITMICSGDGVNPAKAAALGLVFDAVPAERLVEEGMRLIEHLQSTGAWQATRKIRSQPVGLSQDQATFAFAAAEGYLRQQTKGHYPAPLVALEAIKEGTNLTLADGLDVEKRVIAKVIGSTISANLIALFFMRNRLARDPGIEDKMIVARDVRRVGVLGAGLMGAGIATAHARTAIPTAMVDINTEQVANGLARAKDVVASRIKIGRATPDDMADMLGNLTTATSHNVFAECDVVIEAIIENEQAKTAAYRELSSVLKDDAILASNTSTIAITRLAQSAPNADRFVGMHFFNPVDRMQLVEVIRGEETSDETVATIVALAKRVRKSPIVVRDCAGFLVNRILFPYMTESVLLLTEGASMDAIDKAATRFGMPMGPILLHDVVGLDTALYAGKVVHEAYADRSVDVPILADLVQAGRLGQKSGSGFRKFTGKKSKGVDDPDFEPILAKHRTAAHDFSEEEITDRLFLPMLFEATRALAEGIVREPADVDLGLILGIGFPPFRGGVLRWCDSEGADAILSRAEKYAALGKRFEPDEMLKTLAAKQSRFYPRPDVKTVFGG